MRFTGTIVTYDENAFVVDYLVHLELVDNRSLQTFRHAVRHDIGLYEFLDSAFCFCALNKLYRRFDWLEAY